MPQIPTPRRRVELPTMATSRVRTSPAGTQSQDVRTLVHVILGGPAEKQVQDFYDGFIAGAEAEQQRRSESLGDEVPFTVRWLEQVEIKRGDTEWIVGPQAGPWRATPGGSASAETTGSAAWRLSLAGAVGHGHAQTPAANVPSVSRCQGGLLLRKKRRELTWWTLLLPILLFLVVIVTLSFN